MSVWSRRILHSILTSNCRLIQGLFRYALNNISSSEISQSCRLLVSMFSINNGTKLKYHLGVNGGTLSAESKRVESLEFIPIFDALR